MTEGEPQTQDVVNLENTLWRDDVKLGEVGLVVVVLRVGGDCPAFLPMLIIFCLPLIIRRPGVPPVMKTLNHKVYI